MRVFYTDGSYGNQGIKAGGWALIETQGETIVREMCASDFSKDVTSNKMELRAAIEAARMVNLQETAMIYSDSQYVVKGITNWIKGWQKNNWKTANKKEVLNQELWKELLLVTNGKDIGWQWVRSHVGNYFNEAVDTLAKECYINPPIKQLVKQNNSVEPSLMMPGNVFHLGDASKRYTLVIQNVKLKDKVGLLAKLLANEAGQELEFLSYEGLSFYLIKECSKSERKSSLMSLNNMSDLTEKNLSQFKRNCVHVIENNDESAQCSVCEQDFGWWCDESPDHCCHYYSDDGEIKLLNGQKVKVPDDHNDRYETDDQCIFCGDPQERK